MKRTVEDICRELGVSEFRIRKCLSKNRKLNSIIRPNTVLTYTDLNLILRENPEKLERFKVFEQAKEIVSKYNDAACKILHKNDLDKMYYSTAIKVVNNKDRIIIEDAYLLIEKYNKGFQKVCPHIMINELNMEAALEVQSYRSDIIKEDLSFYKSISESLLNWERVSGVPHYFFYYYFDTKRYSRDSISECSRKYRELIWNFKRGKEQDTIAEMVKLKLDEVFGSFNSQSNNRFCFVCIPASTISNNNIRWKQFSDNICKDLGLINGFEHISINENREATHLGGSFSKNYSIDSVFFRDKYVILFDDLTTKGRAVRGIKEDFQKCGATAVCLITIGKTVNKSSPKMHHPYSGELCY